MKKLELKPCPFCGYKKARVMWKKIAGTNYQHYACSFIQQRYYVMCNKCYAKGGSIVTARMSYGNPSPYTPIRYSKELCESYKQKAIEKWNKRATM